MKKKTVVLFMLSCLVIIAGMITGCTNQNAKNQEANNNVNFKMSSASGKTGSNVSVNISISNINKNSVAGCKLDLKYDKNALEVASVSSGDIVKNSAQNFDYQISSEKGTTEILYTAETPDKESISKNGVFAKINFKIKNGSKKGKKQISFSGNKEVYNSKLKKINADFENGSIEIK